jgi:hypothetical protein
LDRISVRCHPKPAFGGPADPVWSRRDQVLAVQPWPAPDVFGLVDDRRVGNNCRCEVMNLIELHWQDRFRHRTCRRHAGPGQTDESPGTNWRALQGSSSPSGHPGVSQEVEEFEELPAPKGQLGFGEVKFPGNS